MTQISEKQFGELQQEMNACVGASASFNVYRDDHDYFVLGIKANGDQSKRFGIRFFYCTYIAGPTRWDNLNLSVAQENLPSDESLFVVQDVSVGFLVKCHGPIDFEGDPGRVYPRS